MNNTTRRALNAKLEALKAIPTECLSRKQALLKLNTQLRLNKAAKIKRSRSKLHIDDILKVGHSVTQ